MWTRSITVCAILLFAAALARAQENPANQDITVTAKRENAKTALRDTRAVLSLHEGQIARFETPICPAVVGLPPAHAQIITARIRGLAQAVGLRQDAPGCRANVTVVIADDGSTFLASLARRRPMLFERMALPDRRALFAGKGPVWHWSSTDVKRRDGGPVEHISAIDLSNGGPPQPVATNAFIVPNASLSRLSMPIRQDMTLAFVVLRAEDIIGLTLRQIADFCAMTALGGINQRQTEALHHRSILTMFSDSRNGATLESEATAFDTALLAGLYAGNTGFSADQQSVAIARRVDVVLQNDPDERSPH